MSQDFRKATWGMSPSQVKSSESSKLVEETSRYLIYETTIAGFDVLAGYIFAGDKLTRGKYLVMETHVNNDDYLSDFAVLNGYLTKKYGNPVEKDALWKTDSPYKNDESEWGHEISMGRLMVYAVYRSSNTEIEISLAAEDYNPVIEIQYSSMSAELQSAEEEKVLEDF